jgi:hypothetical protein
VAVRDEKTEWLRIRGYRQMTPAERMQMAAEMFEESLDITRSAILDERPDITLADLKREIRRRVLPRGLFEASERAIEEPLDKS